MDDFDKSFTKEIVLRLTKRLGRRLTSQENEAICQTRSGIAYEMMMDYISDSRKTNKEIEEYVESVTRENKKTTHNKT